MQKIKTFSVYARIQAGTEASLNALKQKYNPSTTEKPYRPITKIPLVSDFLANPLAEAKIKKTLGILASKNIPFSQPFYEPSLARPRVGDGVSTIRYKLTRSQLTTLKESIIFYNKTARRIMTTAEAQWETVGPTVLTVKVATTPDQEKAEEIFKELKGAEKPADFVVDGLLFGDHTAVSDGEEQFTFFPFATPETVVQPSAEGLRLKEENKELKKERQKSGYAVKKRF